MAQIVQLYVTLVVQSARDLPKTDTFSSIDAYIVCTPPNQPKFHTKTIDNNTNPIWDSPHSFNLTFDPLSNTLPELVFELWDKNSVSKDKQVGVATLKTTPEHLRDRTKIHHLPIVQYDSKHDKHKSELLIQFTEYSYTAQSLYNLAAPSIPGLQFDPTGMGKLFVPLPALGPIVMGIEFEKKNCVDIKLYFTEKDESKYLDVVRVGHKCSQVRRRRVRGPPVTIFRGIQAYEEVKLNDVPFSEAAEPGKILFFLFNKKLVKEVSMAEVVTRHGWEGAMDFGDAVKKLKNVEFIKSEEEIWIKQDDSYIVIDFDKDNVDMKCMVLDIPANNNFAYDFTFDSDDAKKTSEIYVPPRPVLGGKHTAQRKLELDDVPFGTPFNKMVWYKYELSNQILIKLFDIIKFHPF